MAQLIAVALLLFSTLAESAAPERGRLCLGKSMAPLKECSDVTGLKLTVDPAETERVFVWTSADSATVHAGVLPAKATSIDLSPSDATSTMQLTIEGDRARGWPLPVIMALSGGPPGTG